MKWIESKEGLIRILKDPDLAASYQEYLDDVIRGLEWAPKEGPFDYETWEEDFLDQLEWENSDEFKRMCNSGGS